MSNDSSCLSEVTSIVQREVDKTAEGEVTGIHTSSDIPIK